MTNETIFIRVVGFPGGFTGNPNRPVWMDIFCELTIGNFARQDTWAHLMGWLNEQFPNVHFDETWDGLVCTFVPNGTFTSEADPACDLFEKE